MIITVPVHTAVWFMRALGAPVVATGVQPLQVLAAQVRPVGQALPQPPQFAAEVASCASQPLLTVPSQSS
jgi:hypothetical protein